MELHSHCVTSKIFSDLRNASRFCVCALSPFFLYYITAIHEEICCKWVSKSLYLIQNYDGCLCQFKIDQKPDKF